MMRSIRLPEYEDKTYNDLVEIYQKTHDEAAFAEIFCNLYKLLYQVMQKYASLQVEDKVSLALQFLYNAVVTYDLEKAPGKFTSYAMVCIDRSFIRESKHQNTDKRKAQYYTVSKTREDKSHDKNYADPETYCEDLSACTGFKDIEFLLSYKNLNLSNRERMFIEYVLQEKTTREIAEIWGVSLSRVHIVKNRLQEKLKGPSEDWADSIAEWERNRKVQKFLEYERKKLNEVQVMNV